jgi:hypothetical protein
MTSLCTLSDIDAGGGGGADVGFATELGAAISTAEDAAEDGAEDVAVSRAGLLFLGAISDLHCNPKMPKNKQKIIIFREK